MNGNNAINAFMTLWTSGRQNASITDSLVSKNDIHATISNFDSPGL